jgi:hypothetical protein
MKSVRSRTEHRAAPRSEEDRRAHYRLKVRWWAQIEVGMDRFPCTISDLSQGGARARVAQPVITMDPVRLQMPPFGDFEGRIVWSNDGIIGIQFAPEEHRRVAKLIASGLNKLPM